VNSRAKGVRGELELAHWLEAHGVSAVRGQQHAGGSGQPDVRHALAGIHIECKRTERLELWDGLAQAARDCGDLTPVLFFRRNRWQWYCALPAEDLVALLTAHQPERGEPAGPSGGPADR
jgi:hypothetical protein